MPIASARASNQARVRSSNRREVLQRVIDGGGLASRASVARATGLTSATASSIVAELIEAELVENAGLADSTGGKPATSLRIRTDARGLGVVIVRRHSIRAAVVDLTGELVVEITPFRTNQIVGLADVRRSLAQLVEVSPLALLAIGVDHPGASADGVILESVQLGLHDLPLRDELADLAPCGIFIINDADADALREYTLAPTDDGSLFSLSLGVGVGGALVLGGAPYPGPGSLAGEVGHVRVDFAADAPMCECGNRGCLERIASLTRLLDLEDDTLATSDNPTPLELPTDPAALKHIQVAITLTARMLITVCAAVNVRTVVIGGGAPRLGDGFIDELQRNCDELRAVGAEQLELRYAIGAVTLPFRGGAEHALREALGVRWTAPATEID